MEGAAGKVAEGVKSIFTARNIGLVIGGAIVANILVKTISKVGGPDIVEAASDAIASLVPGRS